VRFAERGQRPLPSRAQLAPLGASCAAPPYPLVAAGLAGLHAATLFRQEPSSPDTVGAGFQD
jgi:hypothetical protein